jgi:head-tail adaptor
MMWQRTKREPPHRKNASVFTPIRAGFLRQRIIIQTPQIVVPDGGGGGVYGWSDVATVWARVTTLNPGQRANLATFREGQLLNQQIYNVLIRYDAVTTVGSRPNITTAMRILYDSDITLQIDSIINVDVLNWTVEMLCSEIGRGDE